MLCNSITYGLLSQHTDCIVNTQLKAFVCNRSKVHLCGSRLACSNVLNTKERLMLKVVELRNNPKNDRK